MRVKAFSLDAKKAGTLANGQKAPKTFRGDKSFMENGKLTGRAWDAAANEVGCGKGCYRLDVKKDKPQA